MSFGMPSSGPKSSGTHGNLALDVPLVCLAAGIALVVLRLAHTPWWLIAAVGAGLLLGAVTSSALSRYRRHTERRYAAPLDTPPAPRRFVGRDEEIRKMLAYLAEPSQATKVIAITGDPGIGKTALATQFSSLVRDQFPGGQLFSFVNQPDEKADGVFRTLGSFIKALQSRRPRRQSVPGKPAARARRYARLTRNKKVVVVLDDVDDVDERSLRKLFPAGPQCVVILTSRHPVNGIDALPVALDSLSDNDALDLLKSVVGKDRVDRNQGAARSIVDKSSKHPLSVRLAGMSLVARPYLGLDLAVDRIREDPSGEARPKARTLDLSFALLTDDEQRALCCLGLLDDRTFALWTLAALMGVDEESALKLVDSLSFVGLVQRTRNEGAGLVRFRVHEHVRDYARAMRDKLMSADEQTRLLRKLDVERRERSRFDTRTLLEEGVPRLIDAGRLAEAANDARHALELIRESDGARHSDQEALALASLADLQAELGYTHVALGLVTTARDAMGGTTIPRAERVFGKAHRRLRKIDEAVRALRTGIREAQNLHDVPEQIRLLRELSASLALGRKPEHALQPALDARELCEKTPGCRSLLPGVLWAQGNALFRAGVKAGDRHLAEAGECLRDAERAAMEVEAQSGVRDGQLLWRAWIAELRAERAATLGNRTAEVEACAADAMARFTTARHRYGIAYCRLILGRSYEAQANRLDDAEALLTDALKTFQSCEDPWIEAEASKVLGAVRFKQGQDEEGEALFEDAVRVFVELGDDTKLESVLAELKELRERRPAPQRRPDPVETGH